MRLPHPRLLAVALAVALPAAASLAQSSVPPDLNPAETVSRPTEPASGSLEAAPKPTGYESDLYCFGYLGASDESFIGQVQSAQDVAEQVDFTTSDLLYLNVGADKGLKSGDEYWLVTREEDVVSPVTGQSLGRFYKNRGRGVVQSISGRAAILRVTEACTDIPLGASLKKFEPIPIPLARKSPQAQPGDPATGKPQGHIVFSRDGVVALGMDQDVILDLGVANGVQPGDFLTIYRYSSGRDYGIAPKGTYWINTPPPPGVEIPRTYLGEIAVLEVGDRWAIGRITDSYRLVEVGDEVELK
jgi:hypothetical protein